jgi:hypothetical protein
MKLPWLPAVVNDQVSVAFLGVYLQREVALRIRDGGEAHHHLDHGAEFRVPRPHHLPDAFTPAPEQSLDPD